MAKVKKKSYKKDPNPYQRGWDRWYNSKEHKKHKADEKRLKRDPAFVAALKGLQDTHPLGTRALSGGKCREIFFKSKSDKNAWTAFCATWGVELRPLMWGRVQRVSPIPFSISLDAVGNPMKVYANCPTESQARAFLPVELLYSRLTFGPRITTSGRKPNISRNKRIRAEYKKLSGKKLSTLQKELIKTDKQRENWNSHTKPELIRAYLAIKNKLSEDRVYSIMHSRNND
jgi:hypothetical protein